jgi:hypothetical protein
MKNRHIQKLITSSKLSSKNARCENFDNGILTYHDYSEINSKLSWWADVLFILNDYRVDVMWQHPRLVFADHISKELILLNEDEDCDIDPFSNTSPNYVASGKSRKRIQSWTSDPIRDESICDLLKKRENQETYLIEKSKILIKPTISIKWGHHSKLVDICVPIEVYTLNDLKSLALMTEGLLKRKDSLESLFPNYIYSKGDYIRDLELVKKEKLSFIKK